jgi:hypothetical protein
LFQFVGANLCIFTLELNLEPSEGAMLFDQGRYGAPTELIPIFVEELLTHGIPQKNSVRNQYLINTNDSFATCFFSYFTIIMLLIKSQYERREYDPKASHVSAKDGLP